MINLQQIFQLILNELRTVHVFTQALNSLDKAFKRAVAVAIATILTVSIHTLQMNADDVQNLTDHVRRVSQPVYFLNDFAHNCDVCFEFRIKSGSQLGK